jgi:hypothetical protein
MNLLIYVSVAIGFARGKEGFQFRELGAVTGIVMVSSA